MAISLSTNGADAYLEGVSAALSNGYIHIYSGTAPASADTAATGTLLASGIRFGATAFGSPTAVTGGRRITANAITDDAAADATGTAGYFRCLRSNNSSVVLQGSVGLSGSGADLIMDNVNLEVNGLVGITSLTITLPTS